MPTRDQGLGGAVIVVSIFVVRGGLAATGLGNATGALGQVATWTGMGTHTTPRETFFGDALALVSAIRIVGGIGIWRSRRWGFVLTAALSTASLLLDLGHLAHHTGLVGLPLDVAILFCCGTRLSGKRGATPA